MLALKRPTRPLAVIVGTAAAAGLLALVPKFEGTKLTTYRDPIGVLTYCTGATEDAAWGKTYSPAECREQLDRDLARHAEGVMGCINAPLTPGQKIAFVDLAYNVGVGAVCNSSIAKRANAGNVLGACEKLDEFVCVAASKSTEDAEGPCAHKPRPMRALPGLVRRRAMERRLCEGGQ
ncbi:MAG: lysozyme [Paraburkholderia sp.]|uniref:lysozyme n=1 Tax=Paraburkholderia sp. TaxID=1926495 RepID=UPI003978BF7B